MGDRLIGKSDLLSDGQTYYCGPDDHLTINYYINDMNYSNVLTVITVVIS